MIEYVCSCGHKINDDNNFCVCQKTKQQIINESRECEDCGVYFNKDLDECPECGYNPPSPAVGELQEKYPFIDGEIIEELVETGFEEELKSGSFFIDNDNDIEPFSDIADMEERLSELANDGKDISDFVFVAYGSEKQINHSIQVID